MFIRGWGGGMKEGVHGSMVVEGLGVVRRVGWYGGGRGVYLISGGAYHWVSGGGGGVVWRREGCVVGGGGVCWLVSGLRLSLVF